MRKKLVLTVPDVAQLTQKPNEMGLDDKWDYRLLGQRRKDKGIYIFHKGSKIFYVGETSGETMDFQTRLYRHSRKSASPNHDVCLKLKDKFKSGIATVSLIPVDDLKSWFNFKEFDDKNVINIAEQVLIGLFKPEFQQ